VYTVDGGIWGRGQHGRARSQGAARARQGTACWTLEAFGTGGAARWAELRSHEAPAAHHYFPQGHGNAGRLRGGARRRNGGGRATACNGGERAQVALPWPHHDLLAGVRENHVTKMSTSLLRAGLPAREPSTAPSLCRRPRHAILLMTDHLGASASSFPKSLTLDPPSTVAPSDHWEWLQLIQASLTLPHGYGTAVLDSWQLVGAEGMVRKERSAFPYAF
jgi:hypothetical protein